MIKHWIYRIKNRFFPPFEDISDEFINRLFCANAGMLHRGNLLGFAYATRFLPSNTAVVEVGSYAGLSTNAIIYYLQKYQKNHPFFTCDSWEYFGERDHSPPHADYLSKVGSHPSLSRESYMNFVKNRFIGNLHFFSGKRLPYSFHVHSENFMNSWAKGLEKEDIFGQKIQLGGKIGFCFLDGDHTPGGAERDFALLDPFLASGGFLLLDDSADGTNESRNELGRRLIKSSEYSLIMKNPNYLLMKK